MGNSGSTSRKTVYYDDTYYPSHRTRVHEVAPVTVVETTRPYERNRPYHSSLVYESAGPKTASYATYKTRSRSHVPVNHHRHHHHSHSPRHSTTMIEERRSTHYH